MSLYIVCAIFVAAVIILEQLKCYVRNISSQIKEVNVFMLIVQFVLFLVMFLFSFEADKLCFGINCNK